MAAVVLTAAIVVVLGLFILPALEGFAIMTGWMGR